MSLELSINNNKKIPTLDALHDNYPNPFNPTTTIQFDIKEINNVRLIIYNIRGERIKTYNMKDIPPGFHSIKWDSTNEFGESVSAGVYLYQLQTKDFVKTRKMILLK